MTLAITLIIVGLVLGLVGIGSCLVGFSNFHNYSGMPKSFIAGMFINSTGGLVFIVGLVFLAIELFKG